MSTATLPDLAQQLGLADDLVRLQSSIIEWIDQSSPEMAEALRWQFISRSKYFRPFTIFSCHRAVDAGPVSAQMLRSAVALELFHNVSLVVDDILDRSRLRRGRLTLHCRFGTLPALMTAGQVEAAGRGRPIPQQRVL